MDTKKSHDYRNTNVVNKRKRVVLYKKLTPPRPEMKKYNPLYVAGTDLYKSISFCNIAGATGNPTGGYSAFDLVKLDDPLLGTSSKDRIGERYSLRYLRIKGYLEVNYKIACKINYKLLLIRADMDLVDAHTFFLKFFSNYKYPATWTTSHSTWPDDESRSAYGRHNYYKLVKNVDNWPLGRIVIRVLNDGTITNFPDTAHTTWTVGSNPSISTTTDDGPNYKAYYPINLNITVNDDIKIGKERYYYMLVCDQPIGYTGTSGTKGVARSHAYSDRAFEVSFFTTAYYTDS